jgi:hypothetical protein
LRWLGVAPPHSHHRKSTANALKGCPQAATVQIDQSSPQQVEQERQLRLKADQRASGLKSANQRLQSTVLKLKVRVMDSASRPKG